MQHNSNAELKRLAPLKRPAKLPRITAELLTLMPDQLPIKQK
jgi:hypothetical protein